MSFLDKLFTAGIANQLKTPTSSIDVSSTEPVVDYVLKVQDTGHAVWAPGAPPVPSLPFAKAPASPDAWDLDPALMTDPDLAANGWAINDFFSPWTTFTRVGEVNAGGIGANQYRSSLKGGQLWLQLEPGSNSPQKIAVISKATTSAAWTYKADVWSSRFGVGQYDGNENRSVICLFSGSAPHPLATGVNLYYSGVELDKYQELKFTGGSGTQLQSFTTLATYLPNVKYIDASAASGSVQNLKSHHHTRLDGSTLVPAGTTRDLGAPATFAGFAASTSTGEIIYINAFRRLPLNTFP